MTWCDKEQLVEPQQTQQWIDKQLWIILLWNDCIVLYWRSRWQLKVAHLRQSSATSSDDSEQHQGKAVFLVGFFQAVFICCGGATTPADKRFKGETLWKKSSLPALKDFSLLEKHSVGWTGVTSIPVFSCLKLASNSLVFPEVQFWKLHFH